MKKLSYAFIATFLFFSVSGLWPCFDTFLFLQKKSMVYPTSYLAADVLGEYSFNDFSKPGEDTYFTNYSVYYGVFKKLSLQSGLETSEVSRNSRKYELSSLNMRAVYNVYSGMKGKYFTDFILEHNIGLNGQANALGFSVPNLVHTHNFTIVIHPVMNVSFEKGKDYVFGAHSGLFYDVSGYSIVGLGFEYKSAQNGMAVSRRIIQGESGASIFWGVKLTNLYLQTEFARGLKNARDLGLAFTLKGFLNMSSK